MRVYRVEHMSIVSRVGHPAGPYAEQAWFAAEHGHDDWCETDECRNCVHDRIDEFSCDVSSQRPAPSNDGISWRDLHEDMLFCFPNLDMLRAWFGGALRWLHRIGYIVAVYEVKDYKHGYSQTVFDYSTAERVGDFSLLKRVNPMI